MFKTFVTVLVLNYLAFALMACAMARHRDQIAGTRQSALPVPGQWRLRAVAGLLLVLALYIAILLEGAAPGALLWTLLTSMAALLVALTLTWKPGWLIWLLRTLRRWEH